MLLLFYLSVNGVATKRKEKCDICFDCAIGNYYHTWCFLELRYLVVTNLSCFYFYLNFTRFFQQCIYVPDIDGVHLGLLQ